MSRVKNNVIWTLVLLAAVICLGLGLVSCDAAPPRSTDGYDGALSYKYIGTVDNCRLFRVRDLDEGQTYVVAAGADCGGVS